MYPNRTLCLGDNLAYLKAMPAECVKLVATDPPFNKGRDFVADDKTAAAGVSFQDQWNWRDDVQEKWLDTLAKQWSGVDLLIEATAHTHGDNMAAYLTWLGIRVVEMWRVLQADGILFLHCDNSAAAYVKTLLDGVFGAAGFRGSIAWVRTPVANAAAKKRWAGVYDTIHCYAKSRAGRLQIPYKDYSQEYVARSYTRRDPDGRKWRSSPLHSFRGMYAYSYKGRVSDHWMVKKEKMQEWDAQGLLEFTPRRVYRKIYLDEGKGIPIGDVWDDIPRLESSSKERTGYPTQKPLALAQRIIQAASQKDDMVLDPFCGSATMPVAAERLGRQWIGMDIWDGANQSVQERLDAESQPLYHQVNYLRQPPRAEP